jgi:signal transduction histidine kinase
VVVRDAFGSSGFAAVREEELTLLEAVVEQIPLGILVVAAEGEVLVANAEAQRIGAHRGPWNSSRDEVVNGERVEIVRPDGEPRVLEMNSAPVRDTDGNVSAVVHVFSDVTDADLRERSERDFVTNAAHQLRSPLAAMSGAVEVLQAGAKEVPEDRDRFLAHLERECARLAGATSALLTLARSQSGYEQARLEIVEVRPLLDEVAGNLLPRPEVKIAVECPPDLVVLGNRGLVAEAVANVALNAVRHTAKGRVDLRARAARDDTVVVEVCDTGPGMTPDVQERARERFFRSSSPDGDGFGLGLAIAAQALEATGASLELESEMGRGTVVSMTFRAGRLVSP